jgi:hypothetical protein
MYTLAPLSNLLANRPPRFIAILCILALPSANGGFAQESDTDIDETQTTQEQFEDSAPYAYRSAYNADRHDWWKKPERQHALFLDAPVHIAAGFRFMTIDLKKNVKGEPFEDSFIGSINRLEADQDFWALRPYVQVSGKLADWLEIGVGAGWDKLVITTLDQNTGDGDVHMQARFLYFIASIPNPSRLTPYIEIGKGNYRNSFRPLPAWSEDGKRAFELENSTARHIAAGCDIALYEGVSLNLYVRKSDVEVDGTYIFRGDSRSDTPFTFTMEHVAYGCGLQYVF